MVYIDWKRVLAITPDNFGEDEKEELLETVAWYTPASDVSRKQLAALLKVLQEILKHKAEQVESLMSALDELASKQGEEVARGRQELLDEIDDLREQLEYQKRLERDSGTSDDQLRSEVVRLEMQNEELVLELQEREKDLVAEKTEAERLVGLVARLEREKMELSRELSTFQEESSERRGRSITDSPDGSTERVEELVEVVRQKNKHIMQLLDDVESVEENNQALRVKLTTARNELTEANNNVADLTQQLTTLQNSLGYAEQKCKDAEDKNKGLVSQVEELMDKKAKNDRDLDEFAVKLNERVDEWKRLLDVKDLQILKMNEELEKNASTRTPWSEASVEPEVRLRLMQQEQEISDLAEQIRTLSKEKDECVATLEELKNKMSANEDVITANRKIALLEEAVAEMERQLKLVEEDATSKAEQITDLVVQVRAYEREEFGLTEAMEKLKQLDKRVLDRDSKIENLVATCNKLGIENGNLEDENIYLKEKLGMSPTHVIESSSVRSKSESSAKTVNDLKAEVERLNDEIIELKLTNREMKNRSQENTDNFIKPHKLKERPLRNEEEQSDGREALEQRYLYVVEENDSLRKGMHEILDSLQNQSMGDVQASSLERLLEALDARHVSGWYHPAMRLQAQLHSVQGECRELRSQAGALRKETLSASRDMEEAKAVIAALEDRLRQPKLSTECDEEAIVQGKYIEVNAAMERRCIELEVALGQSRLDIEKAEAGWEQERRSLVKERDALAAQVDGGTEPAVTERPASVAVLSKTIALMNAREEFLENELDELRDSFLKKENVSLSKIISLKHEKSQLAIRVRTLEHQLIFQEPAEKVLDLEKELATLKVKYNTAMNFVFPTKQEMNKMPQLSDYEESERGTIFKEMKILKEKLHDCEAQLNIYGDSVVTPDAFNNQLSILSSKLAASEVLAISEKSKRAAMEKYCEIVKKSQTENEEQIKELSQQVQDLSSLSTKLQEALLALESQLMTETVLRDEATQDSELKIKCDTLLVEKNNIEELLDMSRSQCRSLQTWKASRAIERDSLNECLGLLKSDGSEKLAVARLSQELLVEKNRCLELSRKNEDSKAVISQLLSDNIAKEQKIVSYNSEASMVKSKNMKHFKILYELLKNIHEACSNALSYPTVDRAYKIMEDLEETRRKLLEKLQEAGKREQTLELKEEEMQIQLESLHDLKAAFSSDTKNLVSWHNKSTELRLKETRYKRQNQYLSEEIRRLEHLARRYKEEIALMEEKTIERERGWEERLKQWEYSQLALCELIGGKVEGEVLKTKDEDSNAVFQLENKVTQLQQINSQLTQEMEQKEAVFREKLAERVHRPKSSQARNIPSRIPTENNLEEQGGESEKRALTVTVNSLQAIVKQKEETVFRYQELLKKSREEHGRAMRRLQNELRNVHNALAMQSKAYSRMKHGTYQPAAADIEKYVIKVQELEEEVAEVQGNLKKLASQLKSSQHEAEKWRHIAQEQTSLVEETRERMEMELESCREEAHNNQMEVEHLRELAQGGQTQMLIDTISDLQKKLSQYGERALRPASARKPSEREESKESQSDPSPEAQLRRQLKSSREECDRLRDQIKSLQAIKRRPASARAPENKENLVNKIRKLEETLQLSKQHEQELEDKGLKRIRSVEEVTRWDERKRYQKSVETLQAKLKQKEVEATVAINKLETMRGLMTKMERDRAMLEAHVKNLNDSARESSRMEKLLAEKGHLAAQVEALEEELTALKRHEGVKAAAVLHAKLEDQERKIVDLQLANQAPHVLKSELDRMKSHILGVEKQNLRLESDNLTIKLSLEKVREENNQQRDTIRRLEADKSAPTPRVSPSRAQIRTSYDMQREINKLKGDLKADRARLTITVDRNAELEEEIQRMRTHLSLWEEKDLADTLAKTNQKQMISELHQELIQVKSQLAHKVHLLDRVKILLSKAAAKEKALNDRVSALQGMVTGSPL